MITQCTIQLREQAFEPMEVLAAWHAGLGQTDSLEGGAAAGSAESSTAVPVAADLPAAEAHFIGRVRGSTTTGERLQALELEHYPGMTERQLEQLTRRCAANHGATAVLVWHRVGRIFPGETIVLVAVAADRRGPAQRCGQELLELLKHEAPFWKREWSRDGNSQWLQGNTPL